MAGEEKHEDQAGHEAFLVALGTRIRNVRLKAGLTQEELCHAAGLTQHYLSQVEGGHRNVTIGALRRLAIEVDTTLAELLDSLE
jgi:XRE family transcriptional regulator, aerobic/anaerobic benzoate catabolism transcriptional regulator